MKTRFISAISFAMVLGVVSLGFTSCDNDDDDAMESQSIVDIASANPDFSILVDAVVKADLASTLDGAGTFTVFAPTNEAFEQLFTDLEVSGLDDLSAAALRPILLYHVLGQVVLSNTLTTGYVSTLSPAQGNYVSMFISTTGGAKINKSTSIVDADIMANNGVIHVINKVLTPPTIVDIALNDDRFGSLVAALVKEELVETLNGTGAFTVFAPTDDAFAALLTALGATSLDDPKVPELTPILLYHVASGNKRASAVTMQTSIESLNESAQAISVTVNTNGAFLDTDSKIIITDVQGTNGVIHVINKVLLPTDQIMMAK